jgi:hypothetical protein
MQQDLESAMSMCKFFLYPRPPTSRGSMFYVLFPYPHDDVMVMGRR